MRERRVKKREGGEEYSHTSDECAAEMAEHAEGCMMVMHDSTDESDRGTRLLLFSVTRLHAYLWMRALHLIL